MITHIEKRCPKGYENLHKQLTDEKNICAYRLIRLFNILTKQQIAAFEKRRFVILLNCINVLYCLIDFCHNIKCFGTAQCAVTPLCFKQQFF